jgi:hypothetical protein
MAWRALREPLGTREKLGERLLGSKLGDLLHTLANCPKARFASIHDRWKLTMTDVASAVMAPLARNLEALTVSKSSWNVVGI